MSDAVETIRSFDDLRRYVHRELCAKENLLADQFTMTEMPLLRRNRSCGVQFSLDGPRSVRLGAIWASDHNLIYLYDARGQRYRKVRLTHRLLPDEREQRAAA